MKLCRKYETTSASPSRAKIARRLRAMQYVGQVCFRASVPACKKKGTYIHIWTAQREDFYKKIADPPAYTGESAQRAALTPNESRSVLSTKRPHRPQ